MKTIAQQLGVTEFPFEIKDKDGNIIYYEVSQGFWEKIEYKDGECVYIEDSSGYWEKCEYKDGHLIYEECSKEGVIFDIRPKATEVSMDDIAKKFGVSVKDLKIRKD